MVAPSGRDDLDRAHNLQVEWTIDVVENQRQGPCRPPVRGAFVRRLPAQVTRRLAYPVARVGTHAGVSGEGA